MIAQITKAEITRVIHEEPAFAELFIAHLLARNTCVEEDLVDQLFNSSEKRLARLLLLLANFGGRSAGASLSENQPETLAEMIGTTLPREFFMNNLIWASSKQRHIIEVHSSLLNIVLHDKPEIKTSTYVHICRRYRHNP